MMKILDIAKKVLLKVGISRTKLSEEELKLVIDAGTRSGAIDKTEHELIKSIFEFADITVKEIMVPRPDIVGVDISTPRDMLIQTVIEEGYSRLPVYQGSLDTIVGVIYTKDLLSLLEYRNLIILEDILRPPLFVPESKKISQLLREFQSQNVHMGIVIDEFGGTEGLVTLEDIVEEIVGEIHDEYDEAERSPIRYAGEKTYVDASMRIHDFNEQFKADLPEAAEYETIAGFLQTTLGKMPEVNDEVVVGDRALTVVSKSQRRVRLVSVRHISGEKKAEENIS